MDDQKRILIVEDATIVREGLRLIVSTDPENLIVAEAVDGYDAIRRAQETKPDLILMDLSMPRMNGMDAVREIKKLLPGVKILVLTVHKSHEFITAALEAGADGYVLKDASQTELMLAIGSVLKGEKYISPGITDTLINGYLGSHSGRPRTLIECLTHREREILKLIAEGHKNKSIGELLCISVRTVDKHRENIMQKLNIHNVPTLTTFAIENGLVERVRPARVQ
jgi:DNA-binding NarL/FixJ family response regulator